VRWVLGCLWCAALSAQSLSLPQAVSESLARNQTVVAARERVAAAQGLRVQAGLGQNPRLYLQSEDIRAWGQPPFSFANSTEDYGYFGQVVETGGKRRRRVEFAGMNLERADLERQLVERQIGYRVTAAYWTAAGASRVRDLQRETLGTYDQLIEFQRNRVTEGVMAEADLLRTQLERDRAQVAALNAAQEADRALLSLFREMGRTEFASVTLTEPFEAAPVVMQPDVGVAIEQRPDLVVARQSVKQGQANVALQRANGKPDIDVLAGYKRNGGLDTLYTAVQIPLTIRNRNQGAIAAAQADVRVAQASVAAQEAAARAEIETARRAYEAQRELVERTLPAMRTRAQETSRLARAAYREGGIDLLRLLDTERARIEAELLYFRTVSDFRLAVLNLRAASGVTQ